MDWIPNTIDALTRFGEKMGGFWMLSMAMAIFIGLLLWRHSGAIVKSLEIMVSMRRDDLHARQDLANVMAGMSRELHSQTDELAKQTALAKSTNDKISKWPSDFPDRLNTACKFPIEPVVPIPVVVVKDVHVNDLVPKPA